MSDKRVADLLCLLLFADRNLACSGLAVVQIDGTNSLLAFSGGGELVLCILNKNDLFWRGGYRG